MEARATDFVYLNDRDVQIELLGPHRRDVTTSSTTNNDDIERLAVPGTALFVGHERLTLFLNQ